MTEWYKCPQCGKDVPYITNPCPNCKLRLDWRQQPPIPYIPAPVEISQPQLVHPPVYQQPVQAQPQVAQQAIYQQPREAPQQQVIHPEISSRQAITSPLSNWEGQLPPHIARNQQIWWESFPRIKAELPPKLFQLFGGAKEAPSREIVGKVILVAATRAELRAKFGNVGGSLLNHWNCYCNQMMDMLKMEYMAGTATDPMLTFNVSTAVSSVFILRFYGRIENDPNIRDAVQKVENASVDTVKEAGDEAQLHELIIEVVAFKHGQWENGLETAFRAALWLCSNQEEALSNIWRMEASGKNGLLRPLNH